MSSQVGERVSRLTVAHLKVARKPLGLNPTEIVAASLALVLFGLVLIYYFTSLKPEQERLEVLKRELAAQETILTNSAASQEQAAQSQALTVKDALDSLESFKTSYLKPITPGRRVFIDEVNALARKHSVQLVSGIDMELQNSTAMPDKKDKRNKQGDEVFDIFPRMNVNFTVAGEYANLRRFIADLEHSKQFLVIDSVNLTHVEAEGGGGGGRSARSSAGVSGVALSIDLTTYFQP